MLDIYLVELFLRLAYPAYTFYRYSNFSTLTLEIQDGGSNLALASLTTRFALFWPVSSAHFKSDFATVLYLLESVFLVAIRTFFSLFIVKETAVFYS